MVARLQKHYLLILLCVFVAYSVVRFGVLAVQPPGMIPNDYAVYHDTCQRWYFGQPVYRPSDPSPYKYSPTFLIAFCGTLDVLSKEPAWPVFAALSIILFSAAILVLFKFAFLGLPPARDLLKVFVPAVIFGWHGYLEQYSYGQVDFALFALLVAAAVLAEKKRYVPLAGLLMGCALVTKPQMAVWLGYFLLTWNLRAIAFSLGFTALLVLFPLIGLSSQEYTSLMQAWKTGLESQSVEFMIGNHNQAIGTTLARITKNPEAVFAYTNVFLAFGVALTIANAWILRKKKAFLDQATRARAFCWITVLYLLLCPISWRWLTFMWMPVATILALDALTSRSKPQLAALAAFAVCGVLLQKIVAHTLGIHEVDELSYAGFYTWASLALLVASSFDLHANRFYRAPQAS